MLSEGGLFMWTTPFIYLLIVGLERLFWYSRYEQIKSSIRINLIALTVSVLLLNAIFWITQHLAICWK